MAAGYICLHIAIKSSRLLEPRSRLRTKETSAGPLIERDPVRGLVKISQEEDVNELLRTHGLNDIGEEDTPHADKGGDAKLKEDDLPVYEEDKAEAAKFPFHQIIGKIWWIALISRPDVVFAVHRCAVWPKQTIAKAQAMGPPHCQVFERNKIIGFGF